MSVLTCPACKTELPVSEETRGLQAVTCLHCREALECETFPALWRTSQAGRTGELVTGEEAGCYVHADRRAEAACDQCGRFMCALCEVRVGERHLCVACLEDGRKGGRLVQVERSRMIFPLFAVRVALFSVFLGPFAPVGGLSALTMGVWGLVRPMSVTGRRYAGAAAVAIVLGAGVSIPWFIWWISIVVA